MVEAILNNLPDEFLDSIKDVNPTRACIFGSILVDEQSASDIDIIILSTEFDGIQFSERKDFFDVPKDIYFDIRPYTPGEFETLFPPTHPFRQTIERQHLNLLPHINDS
jgi:pantothenate synthetase